MRAALWLLALFAAAVALALLAKLDQGYVIVVFPPWRMEMSFMLTVVLLASGFGLGIVLMRLIQTALRLPEDLRAWRRQKKQGAADAALLDAIRAHLVQDAARRDALLDAATGCQAEDLRQALRQTAPGQPQAGAD